nr:hypothetical protein [Tanacetum cinerariifolium]
VARGGASDSEYEGERKKALKMYHKMKKANESNVESGGTTWKENFYVGLKLSNKKEIKEMVTRVAFSCEDGDDDSGSKGVVSSRSKGKGQSKEKGQVSGSKGKSNNKTKAGGGISKQKVFKSKKMAQERVEGNHTRQYAQLRDYCLELKNNNPNTTIKIEVEPPEDINSTERKFKRVYVCLGPLKDGFKACKRDLLGLDECFLSGSYPGWILTAVGVDPNNGIYPLAYAIVESKNKDSWKWFLECVRDDLDLFRNSNFTFISDRQKGIIPAIAESFSSAGHRFCLKHIYDNMKLSWRGRLYKEMLLRCATSTTIKRFDKHMERLKDFNKDAYEWLKKFHPNTSLGRAHCDVLLNNMCEVFNRQLVISKSDGPLTPIATKVFNIIVKEAGQMKEGQKRYALYQSKADIAPMLLRSTYRGIERNDPGPEQVEV